MKNNFVMNEDLLKSVIFKQAGSIRKALIECFQNSIDAEAHNIVLNINQNGFTFSDDGCGMNEQEIDEHFRIFGNSSKKNKKDKIGQFGMGRGQVFAFGCTYWKTHESVLFINAKKSLAYTHRTNGQFYEGTHISCMFYEEMSYWRLEGLLSDIKRIILPRDFTLTLNGKIYNPEYEVRESTESFELLLSNDNYNTIYSQNLAVRDIESIYNYKINCLAKMDLNFARNEFIESTPSTIALMNFIKHVETKYTMEQSKFDSSQAREVLELIGLGKIDINPLVLDKPIVELITGKFISLNNLNGKTNVLYGKKNRSADLCSEMGFTVVYSKNEALLEKIRTEKIIEFTISDLPCEEICPVQDFKELDLHILKNKTSLINFFAIVEMNDSVFNGDRTILLGESDTAAAWTDGHTTIWFNLIKFQNKISARNLLTDCFETLVHEYAHNENSCEIIDHGAGFNSQYRDIMVRRLSRFTKFLGNFKFSNISAKYEDDIDEVFDNLAEFKETAVRGEKQALVFKFLKHNPESEVSSVQIKEAFGETFSDQLWALCKKDLVEIVRKEGRNNVYALTEKGRLYHV